MSELTLCELNDEDSLADVTEPDMTFAGFEASIDESMIESDVMKQVKSMNKKKSKYFYLLLLVWALILSLVVFATLYSTGKISSTETINSSTFPLILKNFASSLKMKESVNGVKVVLIDVEDAGEVSFALTTSAGYFREVYSNVPDGTALLLDHAAMTNSKTSKNQRFSIKEEDVTGLSSSWAISSSPENFYPSLDSLWKNVANFDSSIATQQKARDLKYRLEESMENIDLLKTTLMKQLVIKREHPFRRTGRGTSTSLLHEGIDSEAYEFYRNNYHQNNFTLIVSGNRKRPGFDEKTIFSRLNMMLSPTKTKISKNDSDKLVRLQYGVPFIGLPKMICIESESKDTIQVTFQLKTSIKEELEHQSTLYIATQLELLLFNSLTKQDLARTVDVNTDYYTDFALVNIEASYTSKGKSKTGLIIAIIQKTIAHIGASTTKSKYEQTQKYLRNKFDYSAYPKGRKFIMNLAKNIDVYGFDKAMTSTRILNKFNQAKIQELSKLMKWKNMVVVILGDFWHGQELVFDYDMARALGKHGDRMMKQFNYGQKCKTIKCRGIVHLDKYNSEHKIRYHINDIDEFGRNYVDDLHPQIKQDKVISSDLFNVGPFTQIRRSFGRVKPLEIVRSFNGGSIYLRQNNAFRLDFVFLELMIAFLHKMRRMTPEDVKYQAFGLIINQIWKKRLSRVTKRIQKAFGELNIEFSLSTLSIKMTVPKAKLTEFLTDVIQRISFWDSSLVKSEVEEALERVFRELSPTRLLHKEAQNFSLSQIIQYSQTKWKIRNFLKTQNNLLGESFHKPNIVHSYIEGPVSKKEATAILKKLEASFTMKSTEDISPSIQGFKSGKIILFRQKIEREKIESGVYLTTIKLPSSIQSLCYANIFAQLVREKIKSELIEKRELIHLVRSKVVDLPKSLVLHIIVQGSKFKDIELKIEEVLEEVVLDALKQADDSWFEQQKSLAALRVNYDHWTSISIVGKENSESLYFYGKELIDRKRKATEFLKNQKMNLKDFKTYIASSIVSGHRIIFEYIPKPTSETNLGPKNTLGGREVELRIVQ